MARLVARAALSAYVVVLGRCARLAVQVQAQAGRQRPHRRGRPWGSALAGGLALLGPAAGERDVHLSFDDMDADGDGIVDKEEFMTNARVSLDARGRDDLAFRKRVYNFAEGLFNFVEVDGDGVLSEQELEYAWFCAATTARTAEKEGFGVEAYEFHEDDSDHLRELDTDNDGHVSEEEFWHVARKDLVNWGWSPAAFDNEAVQRRMHEVFAEGDTNGNGYIDNSKESRLAGFLVYDFAVGSLTEAFFRKWDADKDGNVDREEFLTSVPKSPDAALNVFLEADVDGDGRLDARELRRWCAKFFRS